MAYLLGPKEKRSRALSENLFLKAERSASQKSGMIRRPTRPGMHGKRRRALSEYGQQLLEKQKVKLTYGLRERQWRNYVLDAIRQRQMTAQDYLVRELETRLDSVVFRLGVVPSRSIARQVVSHGHIAVNGRRVTIPSFQLRPGDEVSIAESSRGKKIFESINTTLKKYEPPKWLSFDKEKLAGKVLSWPVTEELKLPFNLALVIEFYSR
jgi:small subunit ribosomal protein S4